MSITTAKGLFWSACLGVLGTLGDTLWDWTQTHDVRTAAQATAAIQKSWLDDLPRPEPPKQDICPYERVEANFFKLNWTGKAPPPPPPPPDPDAEQEQVKPKATPIADLLKVLYIQVDTTDAEFSIALVKYTASNLTTRFKEPVNLYEGDALPEPHDGWLVDTIGAEEVVFRRADGDEDPQAASPPEDVAPEDVAPEDVAPEDNDEPLIVMVGDNGAIMRARDTFPAAAEGLVPPAPRNTVEVRPNHYLLGPEDLASIGENYLEILSNEVRHRSYRNPRTGRWEGVEILSVSEGSIAAQHGAKSGDVVKSINGHPVSNAQEAIQYVKNNADLDDVWTVVVENAGKERTMTYEKP